MSSYSRIDTSDDAEQHEATNDRPIERRRAHERRTGRGERALDVLDVRAASLPSLAGAGRRRTDRPLEAADLTIESRPRQVVLVVELHDPMSRRQGDDPAWNDSFGPAVADTHEVVAAFGGKTVVVMGSRVVATFPVASVIDAFEAAVTIQRRAVRAALGTSGWSCSIGLATGDAVDDSAFADLGIPIVGSVIDRALLLCSWAQAGSVVADERTVVPALLVDRGGADVIGEGRPVSSPRTWSLGASRVLVGHGDDTLEYWDLVFDSSIAQDPPRLQAYRAAAAARRATVDEADAASGSGSVATGGALGSVTGPSAPAAPSGATAASSTRSASPTGTDDADGDAGEVAGRPSSSASAAPTGQPGAGVALPAATTPVAAADATSMLVDGARMRRLDRLTQPVAKGGRRPQGGTRQMWSHGKVWCWFSDRGRGVIASSTGQEFYVDRRFLVVNAELRADTPVYFVPRDPMARGRNPVAAVVLVEGSRLEARVEHVDERGFGFAELSDSNGTRQLLLLDLSSLIGDIAAGDWLLVQIGRSDHGPVGFPV